MIYFRENNGVIEKYEMVFDRDELIKLSKEVAEKCSKKTRVTEKCSKCFPSEGYSHGDYDLCLNVKKTKTDEKAIEYDHYDEYYVDVYKFDYIGYVYPPFYKFIYKILRGNEEAVTTLFLNDFKSIKKSLTIEEEIKQLNKKISTLQKSNNDKRKQKLDLLLKKYEELSSTIQDSNNYKSFKKKIDDLTEEISELDSRFLNEMNRISNDLKTLQNNRDLNKNQKGIDEYYGKLLDLVQFNLVDTISMDEIKRVNEFFSEQVIELKQTKVLSKK